jgi:hypothetical protein
MERDNLPLVIEGLFSKGISYAYQGSLDLRFLLLFGKDPWESSFFTSLQDLNESFLAEIQI